MINEYRGLVRTRDDGSELINYNDASIKYCYKNEEDYDYFSCFKQSIIQIIKFFKENEADE